MPELTHDGISLHYEIDGMGPALFLIPGMLSDNSSWAPVLEPLAENHTVIRPDPRGAGRTRPWDATITLDALAEDILALADHLGHDQIAVAGHSLGGLVALRLAAMAPGRVQSLVAIAATPLPSARLPHLFRSLCETRSAQGREDVWLNVLFPWLFADGFFRDPQSVDAALKAARTYPHAQPLSAMQHQTEALGQLNLRGLPKRLDLPALAILAEDDAMIPLSKTLEAWQVLGAQVRVIPDAGHSMHWDQPRQVADEINGFLAKRA